MAIVSKALSEAYKRHPEITDTMKEVAKSFPRLAKIINKNKVSLTDEERVYKLAYYLKCEEIMPGYRKIIGKEQHNILCEWGYYKK